MVLAPRGDDAPDEILRPGSARWRGLAGLLAATLLIASLTALGVRLAEDTGWRPRLDSWRTAAAIAVFAATYIVLAIGRLPGWRLDRTGASLLGACLMVGCGIMSLEEAYRAVDFDTIVLLLGMMIVVANLRLSGFFAVVASWATAHASRPILLLAAVVIVTGVLSAFLVNDAICLVMAPLVITLTRAFGRNPVSYLIAVALASNVGSTATITGNPQNMIIGNLSGLPYTEFASALAPVAGAGLLVTMLLVAIFHPREYLNRDRLTGELPRPRPHVWLMTKSVAATLVMIALFFSGFSVPLVAIVAGGVLLLTRRARAKRVYVEIDGPLLLMFAGLFVVIAGFEKAVVSDDLVNRIVALNLGDIWVLSGVTAVLSNIVSNVPAVLVLKPFVEALQDSDRAWLIVAMASTLAGNFTLLGSVANLIVAEKARAENIDIDFWSYFRVGAPLTVVTIVIGVLLLG